MNVPRRLYLITWLADLSLILLVFAVSRDLAERDAGLWTMGWVGGGLALVHTISSVLGGRLSDLFPRRTLILIGTVTKIGCALGLVLFRQNFPLYIGFYWISSIAAGLIYPSIIAWLSSSNGGDRRPVRDATRVLMFFCISWNLGVLSGQLLGGVTFVLHPGVPILFAIVAAALNCLLIVSTCGEAVAPPPRALEAPVEDEDVRTLSVAFVRVVWAANVTSAFCVGLVIHLFADLAVWLNVHSDWHGAMLALMRVVIVLTYVAMHKLAFWHYRFSANLVAHFSCMGGLLFLCLATTGWGLFAGLLGLGFFMGFTYFAGLYYITSGAHDRRKGLASGIHEATFGLGMTFGAVAGGFLGVKLGHRAPYAMGMAVVGLSVALQCWIFLRYVAPVSRLVKSRKSVQE